MPPGGWDCVGHPCGGSCRALFPSRCLSFSEALRSVWFRTTGAVPCRLTTRSSRFPPAAVLHLSRSPLQVGLIKPHPIFSQLMSDAAETTLTFNSSVIPMLCPPIPWTSPHFGAYVLSDTKLMRYVDGAFQHQQLLDQCPQVNLHPVLDALNQLGNCAWKINQPVLDIIISIFNDKGNEKLDIPPPLSEAPKPPVTPSNSSAWHKSQKHELLLCKKKAAEMHSLRMDALYKLSIANYVRDKVFWFPHNMDFRGRTYPCPPYFNHLGNDVTRAILLFAEGRPLGPKGLDWLKIHLVNLTGLKKKNSLQERLHYANEILEEILDSADRPLTVRGERLVGLCLPSRGRGGTLSRGGAGWEPPS